MVAKRGTKREAEAPVAGVATTAKQPRVDPALAAVVGAIEQAEDLPEACRRMLLAGLTKGLGVPSDERHDMQASFVAMVGQVVEGAQAKLKGAVDAENAKLGEVEARKAQLQQEVQQADDSLALATQDAEAKTALLAEATQAHDAAMASLQEAASVRRSGDAELAKAQERKAALENGIEADLSVIVAGELEDATKHHEALLPLMTELSLDQSLLSALPSVCTKKKSDRGAFDAMVLDQLGVTLRDKVAALATSIEQALPAAKEREAAVAAAEVAVDSAAGVQQAAAEALGASKVSVQAACDVAGAAKDKVLAFEPDYCTATHQRDVHAKKLEDFITSNICSFESLRDKVTTASEAATTGGA